MHLYQTFYRRSKHDSKTEGKESSKKSIKLTKSQNYSLFNSFKESNASMTTKGSPQKVRMSSN